MDDIDKILRNTHNRSYPLPERPWKYFQQWKDTLFLHWQCPADAFRDYLPKGLEIDTFENSAWISLVVFSVKKLRVNGFPWLPYLSQFEEINLRTYVIKDGIRGIYMFSIETNKFITILMTRLFIGLPYMKSKIIRRDCIVNSKNNKKNYSLLVNYKPGSDINKMPIDYWLTERHSLYEVISDKLYRFDIHHIEWVLKKTIVKIDKLKYHAGNLNLANMQPDLAHYGAEIKVLLWGRITV
jgi:uncharacterized protein YqjF (DUF2071 family)